MLCSRSVLCPDLLRSRAVLPVELLLPQEALLPEEALQPLQEESLLWFLLPADLLCSRAQLLLPRADLLRS
jgi:hypothetical protein